MKLFKHTIYAAIILFTLGFVNHTFAATEFTCMIDPDNGSGTDYTSLNAWEAANQADLTLSSTQVFSHGGITGTIPDGSTVTGATSGIKGEATHATSTQILIKDIRTTLTGTLTFTNGSTAVTGTGTSFTTELTAGDYIWLDADNVWAEVSSITDDTNLTLSVAYTGTGGSGASSVRKGSFTSGEQVYETLDTNYVTISDAGDSAIAVASCRSSSGTADTTAVTIDGWTTSSTNYIKIWTDPSLGNRHNGKWDEGKYRLETGETDISIQEKFIRIDGLQISNDSGAYSRHGISAPSGTTGSPPHDIRISNNIIKKISGDGWGIYFYDPGAKVWNNIIYDFNSVGGGIRCRSWGGEDYFIYNNTIINSDIGIAQTSNETIYLKNNIVQNSGTADYSGTFDASSDYNISSDDTAPGANSITNATVSFVSTTSGSEDFHLSQSDASARNAGTDLSSDANLPFTTDIDGSTRNADSQGWDIGADEAVSEIYRSVGPSATSALQDDNSHSDTITISSGTATFSSAIEDNIGVGDLILYDSDLDDTLTSSDSIAFIKGRTNSTTYTIQTETGATPSDLTANDTWAIYRAYTSLSDAESGTENSTLSTLGITYTGGDRDLVANNEQWNIACYANGTTADTTAVTIYGWTTSEENYIKVYTPTDTDEVGESQRHNGKWDEEKYRLEVATTDGSVIGTNGFDIVIDGLQIRSVSTTGWSSNGIYARGNVNITISNNLFWYSGNNNTAYTGINTANNVDNLKIYNNVIYSFKQGVYVSTNDGSDYGSIFIYNNTVSGASGIGIRGDWYSHTYVKNNITQNCTDGYSGTFDSSSDYNISDIANDAPNATWTTGGSALTVSFVDESNNDFHLASTDTSARDAGTDLSSDTNLSFTTDIDGNTRPSGSWDIGADEYTIPIYRSVGPSATSALQDDNSHSDTITISSGTATFSSAIADNIGVGDLILYDSDLDDTLTSSDSIAFIKGRTNSTTYTIQTEIGATPSDLTANDTWAIYRAYTSLANAESGTENSTLSTLGITYTGGDRDLVANNEQWNIACYANGTTADTTAVTIYSWTTSEENYIKVYTPTDSDEVGESQRHSGKAGTGYVLNVTGNDALTIYDSHLKIYGLEITGSVEDSAIEISYWSNTEDIEIVNNIIHDIAGGHGVWHSENAHYYAKNLKVYNNIFYNISGAAFAITSAWLKTSYGYVYNNTVFNCYINNDIWGGGFVDGSQNFIFKNNISVSNYNADFYGSFNSASNYNISSDATAPGSNSITNATVSFISTVSGSEDLHLSSTDTSARDAGTDLSSDSGLSFSDDIDGDTRPVGSGWDIGADEYGAYQKFKFDGGFKFQGTVKME